MIKSMTGYGCALCEAEGKQFSVEVKTVNHRYTDISFKLPRSLVFLEDDLRSCVQERLSRGKIDVFINVTTITHDERNVKANTDLAKSYFDAVEKLSEGLGIEYTLRGETFLRIPDIFEVEENESDQETIKASMIKALSSALDGVISMREREGEKLKKDLTEHLDFIRNATEKIEKLSPETVRKYREGLLERMKEALSSSTVDEGRILQEAAIFADKVNVNEETVRLKSHIDQFCEMLDKDVPVGRKIDFLIQEMNREINTIGSKATDLAVSKIVIDVKAEIEKLREQIQNVE